MELKRPTETEADFQARVRAAQTTPHTAPQPQQPGETDAAYKARLASHRDHGHPRAEMSPERKASIAAARAKHTAEGAVESTDGSMKFSDGRVIDPEGAVVHPVGTLTNKDGTLTYPDSSIRNSDGSPRSVPAPVAPEVRRPPQKAEDFNAEQEIANRAKNLPKQDGESDASFKRRLNVDVNAIGTPNVVDGVVRGNDESDEQYAARVAAARAAVSQNFAAADMSPAAVAWRSGHDVRPPKQNEALRNPGGKTTTPK